jgi:hypothetical protein
MTVQEIVAEIPRLTIEERLLLLEALSRSLRAEMSPPARSPGSAERLAGIIKIDGPAPTDQQLRESYTDYLDEKYS